MLVVCFVELSSSGADAGLYAQAKRAFSNPIFICECSAKNDVVIGEVVGFRTSVKWTDDFGAFLGVGVLVRENDFFVGVGSVARTNRVEVCIWSLRFPVVGVTLSIFDNVGSIFIFIRSGTY